MDISKFLICLAGIAIAVASVTMARSQSFEWAIVNWKVRHDFPGLRRIEPKQLADWLRDSNRKQPLLLDVRTKAEFDVSHIHGAQRVEPGSPSINFPRDRPIVTYCSVGYRSGAFAKKLQDAGYKDVQNMSGSIFRWANEGYPIERNGVRADKVHSYNARWGKLLKPHLRAGVPPAGSEM
jgi:rhodanese-related sulfurtransferase